MIWWKDIRCISGFVHLHYEILDAFHSLSNDDLQKHFAERQVLVTKGGVTREMPFTGGVNCSRIDDGLIGHQLLLISERHTD